MKQLFLSIALSLLFSPLFGADFNSYPAKKLHHIPKGQEEGLLGIAVLPEGVYGAMTFVVTVDSIYIADSANARLNVYDLNFKFKNSMKNSEENRVGFAEKMNVHKNNILYINHDDGLALIKVDGSLLFHKKAVSLPEGVVTGNNVFLLNDAVYYYNDKQEIEAFTETGEKISKDRVQEKLRLSDNGSAEGNYRFAEGLSLPNSSMQVIEDIKKTGKYLIVGDQLYASDFRLHRDYYKKIAQVRAMATELRNTNGMQNKKIQQTTPVNIDDYYKQFIGYDNDHNSYWGGESRGSMYKMRQQIIIIINKYGETIDAFLYGQINVHDYDTKSYPTSGSIIAVAPNGDVWFMKSSTQGHDFYKVTRRW